jgi:cysteine desulfurase
VPVCGVEGSPADVKTPIYLDYAATTPVDVRVAERMAAHLTLDGCFGNPASRSHRYGWDADEAVEAARGEVADLLACDPREIVFTSGATESNNLALKGVAEAAGRGHIVTSTIEHKSVLDTCRHLEAHGFDVTWLAPDRRGWVTPDAVAAALRPDSILVSIMHANNEIGVLSDIARIGAVARARGVLFHTDATQSAGKLPLDLARLPVDLLSLSAHKLHGPKGSGALYVRRAPEVRVAPQMHGGGHERGMRSGTLATHQVVGLGAACAIAGAEMDAEARRVRALRERLWRGIAQLPDVHLNGDPEVRLPGNLNVAFGGVDGETLLVALDDLAVSTGSACTSATVEPSYVLRGIGVSDELAQASLRFSIGRFTTPAEVDHAAARVREVIAGLRDGTR